MQPNWGPTMTSQLGVSSKTQVGVLAGNGAVDRRILAESSRSLTFVRAWGFTRLILRPSSFSGPVRIPVFPGTHSEVPPAFQIKERTVQPRRFPRRL